MRPGRYARITPTRVGRSITSPPAGKTSCQQRSKPPASRLVTVACAPPPAAASAMVQSSHCRTARSNTGARQQSAGACRHGVGTHRRQLDGDRHAVQLHHAQPEALASDDSVCELRQHGSRGCPRAAEDGVGGRRKAPSVHGVPHVGEPAPADRNDCVRALKDAAREPDDRCCVAEQQDSRAQVRRVLGRSPEDDLAGRGRGRHRDTCASRRHHSRRRVVRRRGRGGEVQAKGQAGVKCHRPVLGIAT